MNRRVVALLPLLLACGGSPQAPATGATVSLALSPDPAREVQSTSGGQDRVQATITASESGGLGVEVASLTVTLRADVGGATIATLQLAASAIASQAGSSHLAPRGSLSIPVTLQYDQTLGGKAATLTAALEGTDDRGGHVASSTSAAIRPRGLPAQVTLTVSPDPIHEGPCPASHCGPITGQDEATGALTVAETAGIGITLSKVEMELTADADGALIASGSLDGGAIAAQAGSRQVPAGGHLDVPVGVHYPIAQGGRNSTLKLTVRGDDANGNILTAVTTVPVVP